MGFSNVSNGLSTTASTTTRQWITRPSVERGRSRCFERAEGPASGASPTSASGS
jgi:hypothetical protein